MLPAYALRPLMLTAACLASFIANAQTADPGQQIFGATCAACHGLDGQGGEHAPNIATNPEVQRMTEREVSGIVRYGIQGKGMPGFQSSLQRDQISAVVKYLRLMGSRAGSGPLKGDVARGRALYFGSARCAECHSIGGEGGFFGADLSGYGKAHSPDAIREAIVDPNKNQDSRHGTAEAVTREGRTYIGIVRNEDNFSVQMQTPDGSFRFFQKRDLARLEHKTQSLMPADYGEKLSASEIDDLVKFLSRTSGAQQKESDDDE